MKPALERLAEHSLNQMIADPEFHTKVPEYAAVQNELDERLKARLEHLTSEETLRRSMVESKAENDNVISLEKFNVSFPIRYTCSRDSLPLLTHLPEWLRLQDGRVLGRTSQQNQHS